MIMSVTGPIPEHDMGAMLPHEHIAHGFGEPPTDSPWYDFDHVTAIARPTLEHLATRGCSIVADCTTRYFGREAEVLRMLSEETGIRIVANTGLYGAAEDRYIPDFAYSCSADELADMWTAEWEDGIAGTRIRPGFIKTAVDSPGPLSAIDATLVRAAARTHRRTGLAIAVHTPADPALAEEQLRILEEEDVSPQAWIWVHAHTVEDPDALVAVGRRGAWLELDAIRRDNLELYVRLCMRMKAEKLLDRVLLSHDESTYTKQMEVPSYAHVALFDHLVPALREAEFTQEEIETMTVINPRRAFSVERDRERGAGS